MKNCSKCGQFLPLNKFYQRGDLPDKSRSQCKSCVNEKNLQRYHLGNKLLRRKISYKYNLKINYGLTIDDYNKMYSEQDGRCPICSDVLENIFLDIKGVKSSLDHCHISGKNRQILCSLCNTGLGVFKDSSNILEKAKQYVEKHSL